MVAARLELQHLAVAAAVLLLAFGAGLAGHAHGLGRVAAGTLAAAVLAVAGVGWMLARRRARLRADSLDHALRPSEQDTGRDALARGLDDAVRRLRQSPLGQSQGRAALYALPWYVLIGEPAAGKSSAVRAAGLGLGPEHGGLRGVGGTRDCDWFFGTEAVVLDTAGRYAVQREDRGEWLDFLHLLRRARPRAPIDGVVVVASAAELATQPADAVIALARRLRERVHELGDRLAVAMPVYVVFTKLDRIAGFEAFFADAEPGERDRVWGATLSCRGDGGDAATRFDQACAELRAGLRERALARLTAADGPAAPELLGFPLEFAALQPALRSFVATLFDDDPYHLRPLLRGFYFTSAEQPGAATGRATDAAARRFELPLAEASLDGRTGSRPFFLAQFFARVLGADRGLVRRHLPPRRRRLQRAGYALALVVLAGTLAALSAAYLDNRRLVARDTTELMQASAQQRSPEDLASRLAAMEQLQRRIEGLATESGPALGLGQRRLLERRLRADYYAGLQALMLKPVASALEQELNAQLQAPADEAGVQPAYEALKAYLMLGDPPRREPVALGEAIARHWQPWLAAHRGALTEDELLKRSQAIAAFAVTQAGDPAFPRLEPRAALVDAARRQLRSLREQQPPADRVFDEIRSRAAARFAAVGLATAAGPEAAKAGLESGTLVSGAFTREAWQSSIEPAIREAAEGALQRRDWVLDAGTQDDLTLGGSPQQIRQSLAERYRREHAATWQRFAESVAVPPFRDLADAALRLDRLADASASPLARVVTEVARQSVLEEPRPAPTSGSGPSGWMRAVWAAAPAPASGASGSTGAGSELAAFAGLQSRGDAPAPLVRYLQALAQVRNRLQALARAGDAGPGARALLAATLAESPDSELATALRLTDELLAAVPPGPRATLRPLLMGPLQASAAVLVAPAEAELNRRWTQEVHEPFVRSLGSKYPFDPNSRIEAGADEIARLFGPDGSLARYVQTTLGPLVTRRGDGFEALRRGEIGIRLRPEFARGLPVWQASAAAAAGGPAGGDATAFQIRPLPSAGLVEYLLEIDGQALRYRNAAAGWADFVWPGAGAPAGVRIHGTTADGTTVAFVDAPGRYGLDRAFELAQRTRQADGSTELAWTQDGQTLRVRLRVVRAADGGATPGAWRGLRLPALVAGDAPPTPKPSAPVTAMLR